MDPAKGAQQSAAARHIFSPEEDAKLESLVLVLGDRNWKAIAQAFGNRTPRQCRERFKNYLSPQLRRGPWSREEDELLRMKYAEYGPKWARIALFFNSRSDVNIKNRWASLSARPSPFCIGFQAAPICIPPPTRAAPEASRTTAAPAAAEPSRIDGPQPRRGAPADKPSDFDEFVEDMEGEYFSIESAFPDP